MSDQPCILVCSSQSQLRRRLQLEEKFCTVQKPVHELISIEFWNPPFCHNGFSRCARRNSFWMYLHLALIYIPYFFLSASVFIAAIFSRAANFLIGQFRTFAPSKFLTAWLSYLTSLLDVRSWICDYFCRVLQALDPMCYWHSLRSAQLRPMFSRLEALFWVLLTTSCTISCRSDCVCENQQQFSMLLLCFCSCINGNFLRDVHAGTAARVDEYAFKQRAISCVVTQCSMSERRQGSRCRKIWNLD